MPIFQEPDISYRDIAKPRSVGEFRATIIETDEVEILLDALNEKLILTGDLSPIFPFLPAETVERSYGDRLGILLSADLELLPRSFANNLPDATNRYFANDKRVTRYFDTSATPIPVFEIQEYKIRNGWIYASCAYGDECCFPISALSKKPEEFWKMLKPSHTAGKGPKNSLGDGYFEVENNTVTLYDSSGKKTQTLVGSACVVQNAQENILQIADGSKLKSYDMTPDGGGFENNTTTSQHDIDISELGHVYDIQIDNNRNFYIFASQIGDKKFVTIAPIRPKRELGKGQKILPIAQFEVDTILEINEVNDIVCIKDGKRITINTHFDSLLRDFSGIMHIKGYHSVVYPDNTIELLSEKENQKMLGIEGDDERGSIEKGLGFLKEQNGGNRPLQDLILEIKRVFEEVMRRISRGYGNDIGRPRTIDSLWLCRGYRVHETFFTVLDTELGLIGNALSLRHIAGEKIPPFILEILDSIREQSNGLKHVYQYQNVLPKESLKDFKYLERKIKKLLIKIREFLNEKDEIIKNTQQGLSLEQEMAKSNVEMTRILRMLDEAKSHRGNPQENFPDYAPAREQIPE